MKRPSIWPLLVIVMVIGNVFALLVFQDRLQTSELEVADTEQTFRQQANLIQSLERELQEARQEMVALQTQLDQIIERESARVDEVESLRQEITTIQTAQEQLEITSATESDDFGSIFNWTFTLAAFAIAMLELVFIGP